MQIQQEKVPKARLKKRLHALKTICNEINPYAPISEEMQKKLKDFDIREFHDPFFVTNKLLLLLEDTIEEIEVR